MRREYVVQSNCQVVRYSILPRALADPYRLAIGTETVGCAGIWNDHFPDRITELFTVAEHRHAEPDLVRALVERTGAKELEVQTNILDGERRLKACTTNQWVENLLFESGRQSSLSRQDLVFRPRETTDEVSDGDWVVECEGRVLGAGGWLTHYNPPYADLYMEVNEAARGQGVGSYLVQELRRACEEAGHKPAARCNPENEASRRTLERGGLRLCGEILVGRLEGAVHPD